MYVNVSLCVSGRGELVVDNERPLEVNINQQQQAQKEQGGRRRGEDPSWCTRTTQMDILPEGEEGAVGDVGLDDDERETPDWTI